jgi:hypothetical protein
MKFYGEMRVQGSGPLDGDRFDSLAYALAAIEDTDPTVQEVDLTASLAQGWVTASMIIEQDNLELAIGKLIATVRSAIYPNGDSSGGWKFLTESAGLSVQPAGDRGPGTTGLPAGGPPARDLFAPATPARGVPAGGVPARGVPAGGGPAGGATPGGATPGGPPARGVPAPATPAAAPVPTPVPAVLPRRSPPGGPPRAPLFPGGTPTAGLLREGTPATGGTSTT